MQRKYQRAIKPDAQAFDEIRIKTIPRFKESELSGSEWRISALTQFMRNGVIIHETTSLNIEAAVRVVDYHYLEACANGKGYFAGEGHTCDQEGCSAIGTEVLEKVSDQCGKCGSSSHPEYARPFRRFCKVHATRGDSSLDDCDSNYKRLNRNDGSNIAPNSGRSDDE